MIAKLIDDFLKSNGIDTSPKIFTNSLDLSMSELEKIKPRTDKKFTKLDKNFEDMYRLEVK